MDISTNRSSRKDEPATGQSSLAKSPGLPAQRFDASGRAHVDLRAVTALAVPLIANSGVQIVLNLTDVWYIGHLSTKSLAAVGTVHWLVLVTILLFSGVGMAVQTVVAQAFGGRRYVRAGQAIGAGSREWAERLGNFVIGSVALLMGGIGLLLAIAGPWVLPVFTSSSDPEAIAAIALGTKLLWLAAAYQFFDGLQMGSSLCLRGAGDALMPAVLVLALSWLVFLPLAHALTFAPGQGWFDFLPQMGWGATGAWIAVVIYLMLLGIVMFARWRSGAWRRIAI